MTLFAAMGFAWDRSALPSTVPTYSVERACFRFYKMLPEFVWDASVLEDNPFTYPEVKTLLDGVTVGGRKVSDQEQILNLAESSKYLLSLVKTGAFDMSKAVFTAVNQRVARNEALEWGVFRGEGQEHNYTPSVAPGTHGRYTPLATVAGAPELNRVYHDGIKALDECAPLERALAFFLFGALQQFFFDGNKRTSRMMMNGVLMSEGIDAISIPASAKQAFNEKIVRFYLSHDATEMMALLIDCHPDAAALRRPRKHNTLEP